MIIDPPIKELCEKVDCRYTLVVLAAKRARRLVNGSEALVSTKEKKPVSVALKEIDQGLVGYKRRDNESEL